VRERERERCGRVAEYNSRHRNVAVCAKLEDKDGKNAKRLKKLLDKTEDRFESLLLKFEEQSSQLKAMNSALQEQVAGLRAEREALSELLAEREREGQAASSTPSDTKQASSSNMAQKTWFNEKKEEEEANANANAKKKNLFESSTDVTDDILGAIARVGFPDSNKNGQQGSTTTTEAKAVSTSTSANDSASSKASDLKLLPSVTVGCDDIQVMALIHSKLQERGFYCDDEEIEDWYFGETTQKSVMAFQCANGLTENGSVTQKEWEILLENEKEEFKWDVEQSAADTVENSKEEVSTSSSSSQKAKKKTQQQATDGSSSSSAEKMLGMEDFPLLREGDGGSHVRLLQLALDKRGCCVSEDESEFWFFGDSTETALKVFQSCNGLPESGIVDGEVWAKLCDGISEEVCNLDFFKERTGGERESDEADPHNIDRAKKGVFLIGEGRYEDPDKLAERNT
jgi:peptidoglycan hydrolase-like protein with peptidoglycan-binding domain